MNIPFKSGSRFYSIYIILNFLHAFLTLSVISVYLSEFFIDSIIIYFNEVFIFFTLIWSLYTWYIKTKSKFDPYLLFLIAAFLFNSGQIIIDLFNMSDEPMLNGKFDLEILSTTTLLVGLALTCFHAGALLSTSILKKDWSFQPWTISSSENVFHIGVFLTLIAVVPTAQDFFQSIRVVLSSGYIGLYQQDRSIGIASISQIIGDFFIPGVILIAASSRGKPLRVFASGLLVIIYVATYFFLGYRGWAIMPLLAYIWTIHVIVKPISLRIVFLIGSLMLFLVFPAIALNRDTADRQISFSLVFENLVGQKSPLTLSLKEMGYSMSTISYTLELVPKERSFDEGKSYIYAASTVIPNFFWKVHPAIERGTPADWLVKTVEPYVAYNGGGLGYSFIAESYLNFGFLGGLICLTVQGYLLGFIVTLAINSRSAIIIGCTACFFSFIFYYTRQDSTMIFRPLVWYTLLPYATIILYSSIGSKYKRNTRNVNYQD